MQGITDIDEDEEMEYVEDIVRQYADISELFSSTDPIVKKVNRRQHGHLVRVGNNRPI